MRRTTDSFFTMTLILAVLIITLAGCAKKVAPPPPPPQEPPAPTVQEPEVPMPTVTLNVSPAAIERGNTATLTWSSNNAASVTIDNGVGSVESSGRRSVNPSESTTYKARATNSRGEAVAEARITVTEPPPPKPARIPDSIFFNENIKDAFFDYDQYNIRTDAQAALMSNVRALKERPSIMITVEGHCDERGSSRYNLALGDRRATAAKDFMVSQGIDPKRIDTISYGEERNFCDESNEECWQLNRRAHFVMR
jgi:peptidoglycan-associated lipoprotein